MSKRVRIQPAQSKNPLFSDNLDRKIAGCLNPRQLARLRCVCSYLEHVRAEWPIVQLRKKVDVRVMQHLAFLPGVKSINFDVRSISLLKDLPPNVEVFEAYISMDMGIPRWVDSFPLWRNLRSLSLRIDLMAIDTLTPLSAELASDWHLQHLDLDFSSIRAGFESYASCVHFVASILDGGTSDSLQDFKMVSNADWEVVHQNSATEMLILNKLASISATKKLGSVQLQLSFLSYPPIRTEKMVLDCDFEYEAFGTLGISQPVPDWLGNLEADELVICPPPGRPRRGLEFDFELHVPRAAKALTWTKFLDSHDDDNRLDYRGLVFDDARLNLQVLDISCCILMQADAEKIVMSCPNLQDVRIGAHCSCTHLLQNHYQCTLAGLSRQKKESLFGLKASDVVDVFLTLLELRRLSIENKTWIPGKVLGTEKLIQCYCASLDRIMSTSLLDGARSLSRLVLTGWEQSDVDLFWDTFGARGTNLANILQVRLKDDSQDVLGHVAD